MTQLELPCYSLEINNFSQRNAPIRSNQFTKDSCDWYVTVFPKGNGVDTHISLYLEAANFLSLPEGWKRGFWFRFVIVNQSDVTKSKSLSTGHTFTSKKPNRGFKTALRLTKPGFLLNDKLKIDVYVHKFNQGSRGGLNSVPKTKKEMVYVNGFQVLDSQVKSAKWIFETYPETAVYIQPQDPELKTAYMNILLRIYETLYNSSLENITEAEIGNVSKGLIDLTLAGFKLEWLREKLEKVSAERKKLFGYVAKARQLEKQLKNLEHMMHSLKEES